MKWDKNPIKELKEILILRDWRIFINKNKKIIKKIFINPESIFIFFFFKKEKNIKDRRRILTFRAKLPKINVTGSKKIKSS